VHQVSTVKNWHPGEELERGGHEIIVLTYPADRWIGIEAGNNGVAECPHSLALL
jgi:hypothetical protein